MDIWKKVQGAYLWSFHGIMVKKMSKPVKFPWGNGQENQLGVCRINWHTILCLLLMFSCIIMLCKSDINCKTDKLLIAVSLLGWLFCHGTDVVYPSSVVEKKEVEFMQTWATTILRFKFSRILISLLTNVELHIWKAWQIVIVSCEVTF